MLKKPIYSLFAVLIILGATFAYAKGPGDKVDDFTLKGVDGKEYNLGKTFQTSNYVVVIFISTECPFVQPYTDRLNSLANDFTKKGVTFLGINANNTESFNDVKTHAGEKGYPFAVLKDENNVVADMLGATRTPEVFLIDKNKTILYHGRIDDSRDEEKVTSTDLKDALDQAIAGKEIAVKETKQFGCTIKRVEK
jgi:peroxiredoxin